MSQSPTINDSLLRQLRDQVLIVAAHGSTATPHANRPVEKFANAIRSRRVFADVIPAWLQGATSLEQAAEQLAGRTAWVLPFMTSRGYYTDIVFPRRLTPSRSDNKFHFLDPLGESSDLPGMVARRLLRFRHQIPWPASRMAVIVVGHGTRKNKYSCRATIELTHALRRHFPWGDRESIRFAFIDQRPTIEHAASRTANQDRIVIPFLMGLGPHVTDDLPRRMGLSSWHTGASAVIEPQSQYHCDEPQRMTIVDIPIGSYADWPNVFWNRLVRTLTGIPLAMRRRVLGRDSLESAKRHNHVTQRRACGK